MKNNEDFRWRLESEIDDALMISLIKSARLARLSNTEVTKKLRSLILDGAEFNFAGYVHLLTYLANNLISDAEVVPLLIGKCMKTIFSCQKAY
jgi:hypothetical protein